MAAPERLADGAVDAALARLEGWRRIGAWLRCSYRFAAFADAVRFTQDVAASAGALDHHPEWTVRYREVDVATTTHDAGGLTERDVALAERIAAAAAAARGVVVPGDAVPGRDRLWVPAGHFYSPIVDPDELRADAAQLFAPGLKQLPAIDLRLRHQLDLALQLARYYGEEDFPERPTADRRYCLANEYFPYGDAFVYHALLRHLRPRRVIEVGAGWSSAVLLDTDERFLDATIDCTFVEPYPERLLSLLRPADVARVRILRRRLQDVPLDEFRRLAPGDVLFVDSSHVAKTGSDVVHALFQVLPALADGVWVHFHDVHANFEYPRRWVEEGRSWNEAYFLRAFLMHNPDWRIELHAPTLAECAADRLLPLMPRVGESVGGSLWLKKGP